MHDFLFSPFLDYGFMRRALVACFALSLSGAPVGVLLILRRMSLMGDSLSHAVLPGAAIGFLIGGLSFPWMSLGGFVTALILALLAGTITKMNVLKEDTSFAALFPISLAIGVLIVSRNGTSVDIMHLLFGSLLSVDQTSLMLIAAISTISIVSLAVIYRLLIAECFDPVFMRAHMLGGNWAHMAFLSLAILNLVAGFQTLGTLMALGLMIVPAASSHFWVRTVWSQSIVAIAIALFSSFCGLLISFYFDVPSGPAIVLMTGFCYALSLLLGQYGSIRQRIFIAPHLKT